MRWKKGGAYVHDCAPDLILHVERIVCVQPKYVKLLVYYQNKHMGFFYEWRDEVLIKRSDFPRWSELLVDR